MLMHLLIITINYHESRALRSDVI